MTLSSSHPAGPTGDAAGNGPAKPKFSRRPASFSRADTHAPIAAPTAAPAQSHEPLPLGLPVLRRASPSPASIAWQEDARFGAVMLVLVLLVNLALIYGLPLLPSSTDTSASAQTITKAPTMPYAVGRAPANVTLYSQPEGERRTIFQLNLRTNNSGINALSVSPNDTPAPVARALDEQGED